MCTSASYVGAPTTMQAGSFATTAIFNCIATSAGRQCQRQWASCCTLLYFQGQRWRILPPENGRGSSGGGAAAHLAVGPTRIAENNAMHCAMSSASGVFDSNWVVLARALAARAGHGVSLMLVYAVAKLVQQEQPLEPSASCHIGREQQP